MGILKIRVIREIRVQKTSCSNIKKAQSVEALGFCVMSFRTSVVNYYGVYDLLHDHLLSLLGAVGKSLDNDVYTALGLSQLLTVY